ncbi:unnamed protein product [Pleuronectes platessa]|uniref:Uncharacterized protein n=1 Tax=Pleuronectes platessa TaxID=8262 RepID=A0A9N7Z5Q9_PLEPL|nr:unnamed protein product [Pleuronectes platessa]
MLPVRGKGEKKLQSSCSSVTSPGFVVEEFCIRDSVEPCAQMLVEVLLQDIVSLRGALEGSWISQAPPLGDVGEERLDSLLALEGLEKESSLPPSAGWKKREILGRPLLILAPVTSQVLDQSDQ